jgi:hypothetical protein
MMDEELIAFLWEHRLFNAKTLATAEGKTLLIKHPGFRNADSGPDFHMSRLLVDQTELVGQVELHVLSSDWFRHGHQHDRAYQGVILHVVWKNDSQIPELIDAGIPTLELENCIEKSELELCLELMQSMASIPCAAEPAQDIIIRRQWLDRMIIDRLEDKARSIQQMALRCNGDWQDVLYRCLAKAYGQKVNALPAEQLAESLPYRLLARHRGNENKLEAFIFGQAGFLTEKHQDLYPKILAQEYWVQAKAYAMKSIDVIQWKFLRMHPSGFPTLRLAQFASMLKHIHPLTDIVTSGMRADEMLAIFTVEPHPYWSTHYRFDKEVKTYSARMGIASARMIVINAVVPFLYAYGKARQDDYMMEQAMDLLEQIPAEENKIMRLWNSHDCGAENAADSQALLHCFNKFCTAKKCLTCTLGRQRLTSSIHGFKNSGVF